MISAASRGRFWQLWEAELPRLREVASYWTRRHPEDAADVLSQAMIRSCEAFERHADAVQEFGPWSRRVVKHVAIDLQRERARHCAADKLDLDLNSCARDLRQEGESVQRQCMARDEVRRSIVRIASLPERLFSPAVLSLVHGASHEEISVRLGLQVENVRKRVQHARELLRLPTSEATPDGARLAQSIEKILHMETRTASEEGPLRPWLIDLGSAHEPRYHLSFGQVSTKRYGQRRASLARYTKEHPRGWKKRWLLSEMLFAHGAWEDAAAHYYALLSTPALEAGWARRVLLRLLEMAAVRKRTDWARAAREHAERARADGALRCLAEAYERLTLGELALAVRCGWPAFELERADSRGAVERARFYEHGGMWEQALEAWRDAERSYPGDDEIATRLLHAALLLGKLGECHEERVHTLLSEDPDNPVALCAALRLCPDAAYAARDAARLARQYPGWALPQACLEGHRPPQPGSALQHRVDSRVDVLRGPARVDALRTRGPARARALQTWAP